MQKRQQLAEKLSQCESKSLNTVEQEEERRKLESEKVSHFFMIHSDFLQSRKGILYFLPTFYV